MAEPSTKAKSSRYDEPSKLPMSENFHDDPESGAQIVHGHLIKVRSGQVDLWGLWRVLRSHHRGQWAEGTAHTLKFDLANCWRIALVL